MRRTAGSIHAKKRFALLSWNGLGLIALAAGPALAQDAKQPLPDKPIGVAVERAFPQLKFVRPIEFLHAGDGSNRVYVASQLGEISVFPNDPQVSAAQTFVDLTPKVMYKDKENEEGLLGMAFHPKFRENGQFFVYYTTKDPKRPHTSVISRFRVSKDDPLRGDSASEEEILTIPQPYWNHNGGTIVFGPDGYLYVGLGDGGSGKDPHGNGQNLGTLLGSILRIDVDRKEAGLAYAVPKDNPFVGKAGARGEIWAYGVRNIWRMSFDSATGKLWAADVGQDLWEEINLVVRGGNYGWNLREGLHKFGPQGADPRPNLVEPIWEYHHDIGKSITGGHVYRGKRVPELAGKYLYADFVTGKLWALEYNESQGKVVANYAIPGNTLPVMSFGQDAAGESYFLTSGGTIFTYKSAGASGGR